MGMLIEGKWVEDADRSMMEGRYQREVSPLMSCLDEGFLLAFRKAPDRFVIVASASCPWSHATVITAALCGFANSLPIQWAGGPRVEGYGLLANGPITRSNDIRHVHQLYSATNAQYTGRATVPVLWDTFDEKVLSNSSNDIMIAFIHLSTRLNLRPPHLQDQIDQLTKEIFDGLSNAVYRAGKAQKQDEYDNAVDTVFKTMDKLENRLSNSQFLFGKDMTTADVRLFATLVRFDTVYATHFRCTRKRLVEYPALWRFTRQIFNMPNIKETVDFEEIRFGYYVNDGSHNPYGIIAQQPIIDWDDIEEL